MSLNIAGSLLRFSALFCFLGSNNAHGKHTVFPLETERKSTACPLQGHENNFLYARKHAKNSFLFDPFPGHAIALKDQLKGKTAAVRASSDRSTIEAADGQATRAEFLAKGDFAINAQRSP